MKFRVDYCLYLLCSSLLFLSILLPTALPEVKILILLSLMFFCFLARKDIFKLTFLIFMMSVFFSCIGLLWVIYGVIRDNPGAMSMITVIVFYPLIFGILSGIYRDELRESVYKFFIITSWCVAIFTSALIIDYSFFGFGLYNILIKIYDADSVVIDNAGNYFKFTTPGVSSLVFLIPFIISSIFFRGFNKKKFVLFVILCALAVLSGRRALLLTMFIAPVVAIMITSDNVSRSKYFSKLFLMVLAIFIAIYIFYLAYPEYVLDRAANVFNFDSNASNLERRYQFEALMEGFYNNPIIGNGAGAAASYLRSESQPWAYELSYIAWLFQFGCIGFLIYAAGILYIIVSLTKCIRYVGRDSMEFCYLSGLISFLLANATNPYLLKFDFMWVIFISVGIINSTLSKNAQLRKQQIIKVG